MIYLAPHLGARVSALVDHQLSPEASERALAHAARCSACAALLAAERASRRMTSTMPDVPPPADLQARLLALQVPGSSGGPGAGVFGGPTLGVPLTDLEPRTPPGARLRTRLAVGTLAGAGVVAGGLFAVGIAQESPADPVAPAVVDMPVELATPSAGNLRVSEHLLDWVAENGWVSPSSLPDGLAVTDVGVLDADAQTGAPAVLQLQLAGPDHAVLVLEQRGRLDPASLAGSPSVVIEGRDAYQVDGWWMTQCGDTIVAVATDGPDSVAHELIADLPPGEFDTSVAARIARGWQVLLGTE
ncbi:hypothetical protein Bcav_2920 [Beutenbergia cavernae DSM 12333]|uniref:Transmembrane anti-sigma factor n=1 Tax=Beutenbergia cavernae (strain ATCC BAA-8 / DSM 12333 / CCUG 43141 / JCM 11478 / NBRC 16432 / NCIMB 13614 / HKI 0122) TaxID=471853 RepID=C5BZ50_BEUC1|nr:hypothetical protein [Beutenbergia cavernae]ACQ81165.1 hypothetical protein Bcav_2920 [Beutenbergia cavernae DSM 12333]